jgi:hypothetical protein
MMDFHKTKTETLDWVYGLMRMSRFISFDLYTIKIHSLGYEKYEVVFQIEGIGLTADIGQLITSYFQACVYELP